VRFKLSLENLLLFNNPTCSQKMSSSVLWFLCSFLPWCGPHLLQFHQGSLMSHLLPRHRITFSKLCIILHLHLLLKLREMLTDRINRKIVSYCVDLIIFISWRPSDQNLQLQTLLFQYSNLFFSGPLNIPKFYDLLLYLRYSLAVHRGPLNVQ
jgi:hypothetical protein